ncbi:YdcF family protein [Thermocrinis sp.]
MFFFKKLLSHLILPPGIFLVVLLIIAIVSKKSKLVRALSLSSALCIYALSIEPTKDLLYKPLESYYPTPLEPKGDAIVILGGGAYGTGILKEDSTKRLLTGFILHKQTGLPLILSGGASMSALPEAEIMKSMLANLGVDKNSLYVDVKSRDTGENAMEVKALCQRLKCKRIILVTSAYHMKRAVMSFERAGLEVVPYPTDFKRDLKYNLYSFLPKMSVFADSYKALREYLGLMWYSFNLDE